MTRWTLYDPATLQTWVLPINPDRMTSPFPAKNIRVAYGVRAPLQRLRTFMAPAAAVDWEWEGVIRTQAHYDTYVDWAWRDGPIHVTDHLNRKWEVFLQSFEPEERRPTPNVTIRLRYKVKALITRRIT